MVEKMYIVLDDQKYTGKHRVYKAGQQFPESELSGNKENIKMAIEGKSNVIRRFPNTKDKSGKEIQGKEYVAIKGKDPKIELVVKKKAVKK